MRVYKLLKSTIDYFLRSWKLNELFTDMSRNEIKGLLKEADVARNELIKSLAPQNKTIIRRLDTTIIYTIIRALKPEIVVETGVSNGCSTYFILKALEQSKKGFLYSIDLPLDVSSALIPLGRDIGWLVPERLRHRWKLLLGDAKEMLPQLLSNLHEIDIFLHDSDHSYEHMIFEFKTAWKYLRKGGILFAHDIDQNKAFENFIREMKVSYSATFGILGVLRK